MLSLLSGIILLLFRRCLPLVIVCLLLGLVLVIAIVLVINVIVIDTLLHHHIIIIVLDLVFFAQCALWYTHRRPTPLGRGGVGVCLSICCPGHTHAARPLSRVNSILNICFNAARPRAKRRRLQLCDSTAIQTNGC